MAVFAVCAPALSQNILTMKQFFNTNIGRLRLLALLEGISLLALVFIAVPMKYLAHDPAVTRLLGPVHGALFLLFVINTFSVSVAQRWKAATTGKVLLACIIPFGTFYIDHHILSKLTSK